jgi:hypothetical protein
VVLLKYYPHHVKVSGAIAGGRAAGVSSCRKIANTFRNKNLSPNCEKNKKNV